MKSFVLMLFGIWILAVPVAAQPVKGVYNGLFFETNVVAPQSSGSFTFSMTAAGGFSGRLLLSGKKVPFTGKFLGASASVNAGTGLNPIHLELQLDSIDGADVVSGTLSNATWTATLFGERAVFDGRTNRCPQLGRYTVVIPGDVDSTVAPAGDGYGTLAVDKKGNIKFSGVLADGTKITQAAVLSKRAQWPLCISIYRGLGAILGWVEFSDELAGDLTWIKPANSQAKFYSAGFTNAPALSGCVYQPPPKGTRVLAFTTGIAVFRGVHPSFTNALILDSANRVRNLSSNILTLKVTQSSGVFKGTVSNPFTAKTFSFRGVILQQQNIGSGCFLGTNQSGRVRLSSALKDAVELKTLGSSFESEVSVNSGAEDLVWLWSDGSSTSAYPTAAKNFGAAGLRSQFLAVNPAGTLTAINLGFDGSDGGEQSPLNLHPAQKVAAVYFPAPLTGLRYWASSYNPITNRLDFTGFNNLEAVECFRCEKLRHITVTNLPALKRLCVEACNLKELDLTGNPELADVRAALNTFTNITVGGGTGPKIWHWCTRNNPNVTQNFHELMGNFYSLREFWAWDNNQGGTLAFVSTNLTSIEANDNHYTAADLAGHVTLKSCWLFNNSLTNLVLNGCTNLETLDVHHNELSPAAINAILTELDSGAYPNLQSVDLTVNVSFSSSDPNYSSIVGHRESLRTRSNSPVDVLLDVP